MGGSGYTRRRRSSSFSIFNIFKSCCSQGRDDMIEEGTYVSRICRSDEDGSRWTAEPGIDRRAAAFIDRFKKIVTESECQTFAV